MHTYLRTFISNHLPTYIRAHIYTYTTYLHTCMTAYIHRTINNHTEIHTYKRMYVRMVSEWGERIPCFSENRGRFGATCSELRIGMRTFVKAKKDFNIPWATASLGVKTRHTYNIYSNIQNTYLPTYLPIYIHTICHWLLISISERDLQNTTNPSHMLQYFKLKRARGVLTCS